MCSILVHVILEKTCNRQNSFSHELSNVVNVAQSTNVCQEWHNKLGHPSFFVLNRVFNKIGVSCSSSDLVFCDSCKIGKLSQLPFSRHDITINTPLELVYFDLWELAPVVFVQGFRYYILFVDAGLSLTDEGESFSNPAPYRTLIGSLQYRTYTRPNIAFTVNKLSQFLSNPKTQH